MKLLIASLFIVCFSNIFSDSDAEYRKAEKAEQEFYLKIFKTCREAYYKCPAGWEQTEISDETIPDEQMTGSEAFAMTAGWNYACENKTETSEMHNQLVEQGTSVIQKTTEDSEKKKLEEKINILAQKLGDVVNAGNFEEAERISKELDIAGAALKKKIEEFDNSFSKIIESVEKQDLKFEVRYQFNIFSECFSESVKKIAPVRGHIAFRRDGNRDDSHMWNEGTTYIFLGNGWNERTEAGYIYLDFTRNEKAKHTDIQSVVLQITGAEKRVQKILSEISLALIEELVR